MCYSLILIKGCFSFRSCSFPGSVNCLMSFRRFPFENLRTEHLWLLDTCSAAIKTENSIDLAALTLDFPWNGIFCTAFWGKTLPSYGDSWIAYCIWSFSWVSFSIVFLCIILFICVFIVVFYCFCKLLLLHNTTVVSCCQRFELLWLAIFGITNNFSIQRLPQCYY